VQAISIRGADSLMADVAFLEDARDDLIERRVRSLCFCRCYETN
jgi:hypothetical protein